MEGHERLQINGLVVDGEVVETREAIFKHTVIPNDQLSVIFLQTLVY